MVGMGRFLLAAACCLPCVVFATLTVSEKDGEFTVLRDGKVIIRRIWVDLGGDGSRPETRRSFATLPSGTKVWNVWSEETDKRYRLEIAERSDGAVEMTLVGQMEGASKFRTRRLYLNAPLDVFDGHAYDALRGNGRSWDHVSGTFGTAFKRFDVRWMAVDGLVWDFNPIGAGDYISGYNSGAIRGIWPVIRQGSKGYEISGGSGVTASDGGFTGAKLVLREGTDADYGKWHFLKSYHYNQHLKPRVAVCFGAKKHGDAYVDGDVEISEGQDFGWRAGTVRAIRRGHPSGAYYSHAVGRGEGVYRFSGLPDGFYLFTVQIGNWTGDDNKFSVDVNGTSLGKGITVPSRKARTLSRAVHVTGGIADVRFVGSWIVSAIAVQPVMGDGEDFSVTRGLWVSDGYEPGMLYRNCDYARHVKFPVGDETVDMPEPGGEMAAPPREPPTPVALPAPDDPAFEWLRHAKTYPMGGLTTPSSGTDAESLEDMFRREIDGKGCNAVFVSGMHSRHTYIGHLERGVRQMGKIATVAHARGMKVIDHHDATLLWNVMAGFRVLMERQPELMRAFADNLPSFQFCPNNPVFKKTYFAYLRSLVEAGVDGFQLDEVEFWNHGCACKACRERFHAETGWHIPLDETDVAFKDFRSPLARRWLSWRTKTIANWFVDLRRALADIRPDLFFTMYTTHWGFIRSYPLWRASSDLIELGRVVNYFGTEVMTRNPIQSARSLLPYRRMKNLFTVAYGSPVWGIYYGSAPENHYFSWAVANMLGQSALLPDAPRPPEIPDYKEWGVSPLNMQVDDSTPVADVALLFSSFSRDWNSETGFADDLFGLAQELEAMHVPYVFIGDMSMDLEHLKKYKALCLGASLCMSDREIEAVKAYLADGGIVFTAHEAGCCNEYGEKRTSWPFANQTGRFICRKDCKADAFWARELMVGQKCKFAPNRDKEMELRRKLSEMLAPASFWRVNAPDSVYTSIWRDKDGGLAIHFLNAGGSRIKNGEVVTADVPPPAFPQIQEDIIFSVPFPEGAEAAAVSPDFDGVVPLDSGIDLDGHLKVTLPRSRLKAYTIVKISRKKHSDVRVADFLELDAPIDMWVDAIPLGNGQAGALVWGSDDELRITLDRTDYWHQCRNPAFDDPRFKWKNLPNYTNDFELLKKIFIVRKDPSKLPGVRLVAKLAGGAKCRRFTLNIRDGSSTVVLDTPQGERRLRAWFDDQSPFLSLAVPPDVSFASLAFSTNAAFAKLGGYPEPQIDISKKGAFYRRRNRNGALGRWVKDFAAGVKFLPGDAQPASAFWPTFWGKSAVVVPDKAVQRLYDFAMYCYGAASRPPYAPIGLQAVWTADNGDLPPWHGDYHMDLNVQETYWAAPVAGHIDSLDAYADHMVALLPALREYGRDFFDIKNGAAAIPGHMAYDGTFIAGGVMWALPLVHGLWAFAQVYDAWLYCPTPERLEKIWPLAAALAEGVDQVLLPPDADGIRHYAISATPEVGEGTPESASFIPNTTYDRSVTRGFLKQVARLAEAKGDAAAMRRYLALADSLGGPHLDNQGRYLLDSKNPLKISHRHPSHLHDIFPYFDVDPSADARGSYAAYVALGRENWAGHTLVECACKAAVLGDGDEALFCLKAFADGFTARNLFHINNYYRDARVGIRGRKDLFTLEANLAFARGVQEMLISGKPGGIAIFPAIPQAWIGHEISFRDLVVPGGHKVSATLAKDGSVIGSIVAFADVELDVSVRGGKKVCMTLKKGVPTPIPQTV